MSYEQIPKELKDLRRWVGATNNKIPINANTLFAASSSNKDTWCSFEQTVKMQQEGKFPYIGFVFADDGYVGIDIDVGYTPVQLLSKDALDIISTCGSYTEKSKSGRGFHIILKGTLPFKGKNNRKGIEIYKTGRYFVTTGNVMWFNNIIENQDAIDYVVSKYFSNDVPIQNNNRYSFTKIYQPYYAPIQKDKIPVRPIYPPIPGGCRNISLTSLAGALHTIGYSREQIKKELLHTNKTACSPPLPEMEIEQICNSVTRYKR